jgi:dTDP-4-amino-4,6-dideoxy-D-galactose acyltransferase
MSKRNGKLEKQLSVVNWKLSISSQSSNRQPTTDNPMITPLPFDTELFGYPVGKATIAGDWKEFIFLEEAKAYQLVYIFSEKEMYFSSDSIRLVDTKITYGKELIEPLEKERLIPQVHGPWDERLLDLALESGRFSRFKVDPRLAQGEFEQLYSLWVLKAWENQTLIVYGEFSGFISYSTNAESAQIGLIAVDAGQRGRGIGKLLVQNAERKAKNEGAKVMKIATQANNSAAVGLYEKLGYTLSERVFIYHYWNQKLKD